MASLGSLFVDLGINTGGSLNALTVFSGKFLLLKNAAQQMGKMFDGLFGDVVDYSMSLRNLGNVTDFDIQQMQKWKAVAEQNGVSSDSLINSLKNLQKTASMIDWGEGNVSPYQILGIDPKQDPIKLLTEIQKKIGQFDKGKQRYLLEQLGLSEEMLVLFKNFNGEFVSSLALTDEEVKQVTDLKKEFTILTQVADMSWNKALARSADKAKEIVSYFKGIAIMVGEVVGESTSLLDFFDRMAEKGREAAEQGNGWAKLFQALMIFGKGLVQVFGAVWDSISFITDIIGTSIGVIMDFMGAVGAFVAFISGNASLKEVGEAVKAIGANASKGVNSAVGGFNKDVEMWFKPEEAPALSGGGQNQNITFNVNQNINSNANAGEVARRSVDYMQNSATDIAKLKGAN